MMTVERASELVKALTGDAKIDLFCHFETELNPFCPKTQEDRCMDWQEMFAEMCGFGVAVNVVILQGGHVYRPKLTRKAMR